MAVSLVTTTKKFTGSSTDTKPTNVQYGSKFFEYDTGNYYVYTGSWVIYHFDVYEAYLELLPEAYFI